MGAQDANSDHDAKSDEANNDHDAKSDTDSSFDYEPTEGGDEHDQIMVAAVAPAGAAGVVSDADYRALVSGTQGVMGTSHLHNTMRATLTTALQSCETNGMDSLGKEMRLNKNHRTCTIIELAGKVMVNRRTLPRDIVTMAAAFLECQQM